MADANNDNSIKTVSVSVSQDEIAKLSRTRRRRRSTNALRADLSMPVVAQKQDSDSVVKKEEEKVQKPTTAPAVHIGTKKNGMVAPAVVALTTTAPVVTTSESAAKVTHSVNPVKVPRIVYTKKNRVEKPAAVKSKAPVVIIPKKPAFEFKSKTRKFKSRKVNISFKRQSQSNQKAIKNVATMPIVDVKAKLVAAGLLSNKSATKKSPPPSVLRGMLTEWLKLHQG